MGSFVVLCFETGTSYIFLTGLRSLVLGLQACTTVSSEEKNLEVSERWAAVGKAQKTPKGEDK